MSDPSDDDMVTITERSSDLAAACAAACAALHVAAKHIDPECDGALDRLKAAMEAAFVAEAKEWAP